MPAVAPQVAITGASDQPEGPNSLLLGSALRGGTYRSVVSYTWTLIPTDVRGTPVPAPNSMRVIGLPNSSNAIVSIPAVDADSPATIQLTVRVQDSDGSTADATTTVTFWVRAVIQPPVLQITTQTQTIGGGNTIQLDATESDRGGHIVRRMWRAQDESAGRDTLDVGGFSDYTALSPRWTAPDVREETSYLLTLSVIDNDGQMASAQLLLTVRVGNPRPDGPLIAELDIGRPVVEVEAIARPLGLELSLGRAIAEVEGIAQALEIEVDVSRAIADVEAIPRPLPVELTIARFRAITDAWPREPLTIALDMNRAAGETDADGRPLPVALDMNRAAGETDADARPLSVGLVLPRSIRIVEDAFPAEPMRVALTMGRARVIVPQPEPRVRSYFDSRNIAGDDPVYALEITHPDLDDPIRVVADTIEHMVDGARYVRLPFRGVVPQIREGEVPTARIEVDNVGQDIMEWIDRSDGGRGAMMRILRLVRPNPDAASQDSEVTWEMPRMAVGVTAADMQHITISLVTRTGHVRPAVKIRHDPTTSPGLF